jgi:conjugal transfer pilin signal peptidase TrbI
MFRLPSQAKTTLTIFASVCITLAVVFWMIPPPKQVVVFDLKGTVQQYADQLASAKLNDEQVQHLSKRFAVTMEKSLSDYASDHPVVIMVKPAVIEGAQDITNDIKQHIIQKLKG